MRGASNFTLQPQTFGEQQHKHEIKAFLSTVSVITGCSLHKKQTKKNLKKVIHKVKKKPTSLNIDINNKQIKVRLF